MKKNPWATLAVLAFAQFVVVLDVTIVNVALPRIQADLRVTSESLQWVISAYTLLFGGFLLLGGRMADVLGARRVFVAGLALFGAASLACGLADSPGVLIGARAVQGLGGALLSPAALSILTVTYPHGRERNIALGVWGGLAGLGGTLGAVVGGVLVDSLSWRWVFFVNVPIVIIVAVITPRFVRHLAGTAGRAFDVAGAVLGTAGLLALVYGVVRAEPAGWGSLEVVGCLAGGAVLLVGFLVVESRSPAPLVPLRLFRSRGMSASSVVLALNGAVFLAVFFLTSLYLQQVRGESALGAATLLLPMGGAAIVAAALSTQLVQRFDTKPVQLPGAVLMLAGLAALLSSDVHSSYAGTLLPGFILFGCGIIAVGVPAQIAAIADVTNADAGAASGVVTAFYQVGGALGIAVVTTVSLARSTHALATGAAPSQALVDGFHRGLVVTAFFAAAAIVLSVVTPRLDASAEQIAEASAAA